MQSPKAETLSKSITASIKNGKKLLEDAKLLFDCERFPTAFALSVLAQEEFAKAFLLQLVADGALPWLPQVQRSMVRHECKHLLALVMEWIGPLDWTEVMEQDKRSSEHHRQRMEWLQRRIERYKQETLAPDPDDPEPIEPEIVFPAEVANALNIYR